MASLPLHPALVHLPLGLAFLIPVLALGFAWAIWTGRVRSRAWVSIVALQAVLFGAGWLAMSTGEREEERVEQVVPEAVLNQHEAYAEQFLWLTGLTLGLAATVLVSRHHRATRALVSATVVGTLIVAASALRVGHAGGQLVYGHNAASVYATGGSRAAAATDASRETRSVRTHREGDRDDRERR